MRHKKPRGTGISGISWPSWGSIRDATPTWTWTGRRVEKTRPAVLTESGLCDEVPGHGEYVFLVRLLIADGLRIHLGLVSVLLTRDQPSSLPLPTPRDSRRYCSVALRRERERKTDETVLLCGGQRAVGSTVARAIKCRKWNVSSGIRAQDWKHVACGGPEESLSVGSRVLRVAIKSQVVATRGAQLVIPRASEREGRRTRGTCNHVARTRWIVKLTFRRKIARDRQVWRAEQKFAELKEATMESRTGCARSATFWCLVSWRALDGRQEDGGATTARWQMTSALLTAG